jgi:hypothetical protein
MQNYSIRNEIFLGKYYGCLFPAFGIGLGWGLVYDVLVLGLSLSTSTCLSCADAAPFTILLY